MRPGWSRLPLAVARLLCGKDARSCVWIRGNLVLPLSGAALATIGLYAAVFFWNDWFHALIYLNGSQYSVMLLYPFLQRYFV